MIYGNQYKLRKEDEIIIYGAATTGAIIFKNLNNSGYRVTAFIDERADEINDYYQLPVWNLNHQIKEKINKEAVIIIAIKNVFEHEKIAKKLWKFGCTKIIFRPYQYVCGEGSKEDFILNAAWDKVFAGEAEIECRSIRAFDKYILQNKAIIEDKGEYVIANIPVPYIFTDKYNNGDNIWADIPCLGLIPHIGLFEVFSGNCNEDYKEYMLYCREAAQRSGGIKTSKAWEQSVYKNRLDVYNHMQLSWEHDRNFFVRNAVEGTYNEKGYFNINSGKHRIVFLIVKGCRYVPLRIKKNHFDIWSDRVGAIYLLNYLHENDIDTLPVILNNPYLYHYQTEAGTFYEKILFRLLYLIYQNLYYKKEKFNFEGKKILFYNTPMAMYAKVFKILGFSICFFEDNKKNYFLYKKVLNGIEHIDVKSDLNESPLEYMIIITEGDSMNFVRISDYKIEITDKPVSNKEVLACGIVEGHIKKALIEIKN